MTAVGNCLSFGVAYLTADAWFAHIEAVHAPDGDTVCAICERTVPKASFLMHPCVGHVLSARAAHPSAAEPTPQRDESEPVSTAVRRLRLVCSQTED